MTTYTPFKLEDGQWSVKIGRARNNRVTITGHRFGCQDEAEAGALKLRVFAAMMFVEENAKLLDIESMKDVARDCNDIIDDTIERMEDEADDDFSHNDPRGFLV